MNQSVRQPIRDQIWHAFIVVLFALYCVACTADPRQRIVIAGDSTASSYAARYAPQTGWGQTLGYFITDDVVIINHASSGRSSRSFIDEGRWKDVLGDVRPGDIALVSFGHNDARDDSPKRYTDPDSDFRNNLMRFAKDVQRKGGVPVILSPAARRLWEGTTMVETHGLYAVNAKRAADAAGADFIDLANLTIAYFETLGREQTKRDYLWLKPGDANARFPDGVEDNTHFSELGACGVARVIAFALQSKASVKNVVNAESLSVRSPVDDARRPDSVQRCARTLRREQ